jgi:hypothetical protein
VVVVGVHRAAEGDDRFDRLERRQPLACIDPHLVDVDSALADEVLPRPETLVLDVLEDGQLHGANLSRAGHARPLHLVGRP